MNILILHNGIRARLLFSQIINRKKNTPYIANFLNKYLQTYRSSYFQQSLTQTQTVVCVTGKYVETSTRYHIEERIDIKKEQNTLLFVSQSLSKSLSFGSCCLRTIMATYFRTHSTNLARRILVHRNRDLLFREVSATHKFIGFNRRTIEFI